MLISILFITFVIQLKKEKIMIQITFSKEEIQQLKDSCRVTKALMVGTKESEIYDKLLVKLSNIN